MANTTKSRKGRPGAMPAPKRANNPRTPKEVSARKDEGGDAGGEATETAKDAEAPVGEVEQPPKE